VLRGTSHLGGDVDISDEHCGERLFENRFSCATDRDIALTALKEVQSLVPELGPILTTLYDRRDAALIQAFGRGKGGEDFLAHHKDIQRERRDEEARRRKESDRQEQSDVLAQQQAAAARGEVFCPHCKTVMRGEYCDCD